MRWPLDNKPRGLVKVKGIAGVFSGISPEYYLRRQAVRASWGPSSERAILELQEATGVVVRFVMGFSTSSDEMASVAEEERHYGKMVRLDVKEKYHNLVLKMRRFMQWSVRNYDFAFLVKVDDDVYHNPFRLSWAMNSWQRHRAGFIGCMLWQRAVFKPLTSKWFDPSAPLVGDHYFTYPAGPTYALSRNSVDRVNYMPDGWLRFLGCGDDCSVSSWMMALNVTYLDDSRLCSTKCSSSAITVKDGPGLNRPLEQMPQLHANPECSSHGIPKPPSWNHRQPSFDFSKANCYQLANSKDASFAECHKDKEVSRHPLRFKWQAQKKWREMQRKRKSSLQNGVSQAEEGELTTLVGAAEAASEDDPGDQEEEGYQMDDGGEEEDQQGARIQDDDQL